MVTTSDVHSDGPLGGSKPMPFAGYKDFNACVISNSDKRDPKAYCAAIQRSAEGKSKHSEFAIDPDDLVEIPGFEIQADDVNAAVTDAKFAVVRWMNANEGRIPAKEEIDTLVWGAVRKRFPRALRDSDFHVHVATQVEDAISSGTLPSLYKHHEPVDSSWHYRIGVEVFRSGEVTDSQGRTRVWTNDDLDKMVSAFEAKVPEAVTIKMGHSTDDFTSRVSGALNLAPDVLIGEGISGDGKAALGRIVNLYRNGDVLLADFETPVSVSDIVDRGFFTHVSSEIYDRFKGHAPVLSAVALLGAERPAVKGLSRLSEGKDELPPDWTVETSFQEAIARAASAQGGEYIIDPKGARASGDFIFSVIQGAVQDQINASRHPTMLTNAWRRIAPKVLSLFKSSYEHSLILITSDPAFDPDWLDAHGLADSIVTAPSNSGSMLKFQGHGILASPDVYLFDGDQFGVDAPVPAPLPMWAVPITDQSRSRQVVVNVQAPNERAARSFVASFLERMAAALGMATGAALAARFLIGKPTQKLGAAAGLIGGLDVFAEPPGELTDAPLIHLWNTLVSLVQQGTLIPEQATQQAQDVLIRQGVEPSEAVRIATAWMETFFILQNPGPTKPLRDLGISMNKSPFAESRYKGGIHTGRSRRFQEESSPVEFWFNIDYEVTEGPNHGQTGSFTLVFGEDPSDERDLDDVVKSLVRRMPASMIGLTNDDKIDWLFDEWGDRPTSVRHSPDYFHIENHKVNTIGTDIGRLGPPGMDISMNKSFFKENQLTTLRKFVDPSSGREFRVVVQDDSNPPVTDQLFVSASTVEEAKNIASNLLSKLDGTWTVVSIVGRFNEHQYREGLEEAINTAIRISLAHGDPLPDADADNVDAFIQSVRELLRVMELRPEVRAAWVRVAAIYEASMFIDTPDAAISALKVATSHIDSTRSTIISLKSKGGSDMDKIVLKELGLGEDASQSAILEAITALKTSANSVDPAKFKEQGEQLVTLLHKERVHKYEESTRPLEAIEGTTAELAETLAKTEELHGEEEVKRLLNSWTHTQEQAKKLGVFSTVLSNTRPITEGSLEDAVKKHRENHPDQTEAEAYAIVMKANPGLYQEYKDEVGTVKVGPAT